MHDLYFKWSDLLIEQKRFYQEKEKHLAENKNSKRNMIAGLKQDYETQEKLKLISVATLRSIQARVLILKRFKAQNERLLRSQFEEKSNQELLHVAAEEKKKKLEKEIKIKKNRVNNFSHILLLYA